MERRYFTSKGFGGKGLVTLRTSVSEAVVLNVEVGDCISVLLGAVLDELVGVVGKSLELLDDGVEDIELLVGERDLLCLVSGLDDASCGCSGGLCPEVQVVSVLGDCGSDLVGVVVGED